MKERIDWELQKENQEKKVIARSARNKVTHTGCKLPSDYMTKKEKMAMNGEVMTMEMNKPVKYQAFKLWPADLQKEYLENLVKTFGVGLDDVGEMMGCHVNTFRQFARSRGLRDVFPTRKSPTKFCVNDWKLFCDGVVYSSDIMEQKIEELAAQTAPESHENALYETNVVVEGTDKGTTNDVCEVSGCMTDDLDIYSQFVAPVETEEKEEVYPMTFTLFSFDMRDVKSWDDVFEMLRKFPLPEKNVLSVAMNKRLYPIRGEDCSEKP